MRGPLFLLAMLALFVSPTLVVWLWLWVFRRTAGRCSVALAVLAATAAAGILTFGFVRLGGWAFSDLGS